MNLWKTVKKVILTPIRSSERKEKEKITEGINANLQEMKKLRIVE